MRTALILLLTLALASVAASIVPQWPNSPDRVLRYIDDHPVAGAFFRRAGMFDVFGSWWFVLIASLLFVSLVACLVPRTRMTIRGLMQRPTQARELESLRMYEERTVRADPDTVIERSRRVLRRRMFRVSASGGGLAAEKGALREIGSLVFHWAFLLLLIGVVVGKGTGFAGRAVIVEGQTWTDAYANYDGQIRTGRFFGGDFSGVEIRLRDFTDTYRTSGVPMDFVSRVDLLSRDGSLARSADIRVNHPATYDGLRIFQYGFGWAPVVEVRRGSTVLTSSPVVFIQDQAPPGVPQLAMPWRGVVKLSSLRPQVGIRLELWPDSGAFLEQLQTGRPVAMTRAVDPFLRYAAFCGALTDPSPVSLDTTLMGLRARGVVGEGRKAGLEAGATPGHPARCLRGLSVGFPELRQYSVLQVSRDVGVPVVLAAAILILVGLLPALYSSRRRVWVSAEPNGRGTVLKVGGFALQRKVQFEEEFPRLVDAIERASDASEVASPS